MTGFRRLISYIYEYEGNVKGKNVGFVKLEARNGMCRLSVSVKKLYMGSSDMGVYLLTGRQEIFLGDLFLRSGCGEFRTVVQLTDVQESGESMDECYGLTLHGKDETWRVYTTIWEDAVAQAAQLTLENVTSENAVEREVESGSLSTVVPERSSREQDVLEKKEQEGSSPAENEAAEDGMAEQEAVQDGPAQKERGETGEEADASGPDTSGAASGADRVPWAELSLSDLLGTVRPEGPSSGQGAKVVDFHEKSVHVPSGSDQPKEGAPTSKISLPDHEMGRLEMETVYPDIPLARAVASGLFSAPALAGPAASVQEGPSEKPSGTGRVGGMPHGQSGRQAGGSAGVPGRSGDRQSAVSAKVSGQSGGRQSAVSAKVPGQSGDRQSAASARMPGQSGDRQSVGSAGGPEQTGGRPIQAVQRHSPAEQAEDHPPLVIRQYEEEPLIIGDPQALAKLDEQEAMEKLVPVWDFFVDTYPKIQAFDSEHGCQVLVIKPQDIGLLPREIWIYGNNSFLLHGYYNYRYLILARLEDPKGLPRYLLGVPGHYYSNEKYMASMFGFPHFVLSKRQPAQDGRFGYWYTDIRMEENAVLGAAAIQKARNVL